MDTEFINLTAENLAHEHLCCIIRSKKPHPGIDAKRQWLSDRLKEGHVFRKLNAKATVFIEYAPLETAWVPVIGDNYYYLYCLWAVSYTHLDVYKRQGKRNESFGRGMRMGLSFDPCSQGIWHPWNRYYPEQGTV